MSRRLTGSWETAHGTAAEGDRLGPVCLMEVDPTTARHAVDYHDRTIVFCAPPDRKQFVADPDAYLVA
jgi:YHS domain-containing protein